MKNPYLKIISLTFILTLTFLLTACIDTKYSDIEMVRINAGTFTMGSDNPADGYGADPAHPVTLTKGFYMGKYQVTQKQWEEVIGSNPSSFIGSYNLPVENVNWVYMTCMVMCLNGVGIGMTLMIQALLRRRIQRARPRRCLAAFCAVEAGAILLIVFALRAGPPLLRRFGRTTLASVLSIHSLKKEKSNEKPVF